MRILTKKNPNKCRSAKHIATEQKMEINEKIIQRKKQYRTYIAYDDTSI